MAATNHIQQPQKLEHSTATSKDMTPQERVLVGRLYGAWERKGLKRADFLDLLLEAGYEIPTSTLFDWKTRAQTPASHTPNTQTVGRPSVLSPEESKIVIGYALLQNDAGNVVSLESIKTTISEKLKKAISTATVHRILGNAGFSSRLARSGCGGFTVDTMKLAEIYSSWVIARHSDGVFDRDRSQIASIDFTFTRHTTSRTRTYVPAGR